MTDIKESQAILDQITAERLEIQKIRGLPHIFAYRCRWYKWAREYSDSTAKINLLCAANQSSKSSTNIRKCIDWATDKRKWPSLWDHDPNQFWYLYPTSKQVNIEFETKWKLFLPKGEFKDDPIYGWHEEKRDGNILAIHFNSGVHVYFKTYAQDVSALQSGTCDAIFCDEELPVHLYEELIFRISASDGYFHMVFTATLGQDFWRRAMELDSLADGEVEALPEARKWVVSLYDCQFYDDGSQSHWTDEKVNVVRNRCSTHNEILKRVFGRFVLDKGVLKYPQFDYKRHMKEEHPLPPTWLVYGGVDPGSGGETGHPAAIAFVAVKPDYTQGRVFFGWRGDGIQTTSGDVLRQYRDMKSAKKLNPVIQLYDWADADFKMLADGAGESFEKANKGHDIGEDTLNTLLKNDMLFIYHSAELAKLAKELTSLRNETKKVNAKDDLIDAVRYIVTKIPWNWASITGELRDVTDSMEKYPMNSTQAQIAERRKAFDEEDAKERGRLQDEFDEWNEQYG